MKQDEALDGQNLTSSSSSASASKASNRSCSKGGSKEKCRQSRSSSTGKSKPKANEEDMILDEVEDEDEEGEEENEKSMVGGCCVCGDDTGFSNNLLVYCDGPNCLVAVHQACYGIFSVPVGNWYCRRCEQKIELKNNQALSPNDYKNECNKICCYMCPAKDGAIKRTDTSKWAHVVCALYIPEISFGSNRTMEPVITKEIKTERYNKVCFTVNIEYFKSFFFEIFLNFDHEKYFKTNCVFIAF